MAKRPDELHNPVVVEIEDEFSRLPAAERIQLTDDWLDSLVHTEPVELTVSGAEMVAEARHEVAW